MNTRRSDKLRTKSNLAHCQNVATIKVPIWFSIWQQLFRIGATQHNDAQELEIQDEWNISKTRPNQCRADATNIQQVNEHVQCLHDDNVQGCTLAAKVCRASRQARRDNILPSAKSPITGKWSDRKNSQQQRMIHDNKPQISQPWKQTDVKILSYRVPNRHTENSDRDTCSHRKHPWDR